MLKDLQLLGKKVRDKVTKVEGIVTSISFDLYGCVQAIVNPGVGSDGKLLEVFWYDVKRLEVTDNKRAMEAPDFDDVPGGETRNPVQR